MTAMDFRGRWVLVTGASSGLGREMAVQLARDYGAHLVLVARRAERLEELAAELRAAHGVEVKPVVADLADVEAAGRMLEAVLAEVPLYAAVLNAGVTHFGHHEELDWARLAAMLEVNVRSPARMLSTLLPYLERRGEGGGVLLVASLAGLTPVAYQSAYSGTKAFLVNLGCSLHHELAPRGVTVTTFAPGGIQTEMTEGRRFDDLRGWLVPVGPCAREALEGLCARRYLVVPGRLYRFGAYLTRLLPQSFVVGRVAAEYRRSLLKNT
jgi:hypothetical protein